MIHYRASVDLPGDARCGSLNTAPPLTVAAFVIGFLVETVKVKPALTLQELAAALRKVRGGVEVQLSSIHRALVRAGYSYKKRVGGTGA